MKRNLKHINKILIIVITVLLSSCYNYRSVGLLQENNPMLPKYEKAEYENYKIQINDEIVFRLITIDETISRLISSNSSLGSGVRQMSYRVYPDGTIDIPFIKGIPVAGLTIREAEKNVEARFKEIIPDANVKISLANKTFTVIGEAGTGVFPIIREKMTIYQALSVSGNLSNSGDFQHVRILRDTGNGIKVMEFDIRPASLIESKYYYIYPNDIIYVRLAPSSFYKVNSWGGFVGLVTSSVSLLISALYFTK